MCGVRGSKMLDEQLMVAESMTSGTRSVSVESSSESDILTRVLRSSKRHVPSAETVKVTNKRTRTIIDETITSESVSLDSREGSCEQSQCASDTECCGLLASSCVSKQSNRSARANYFHLSINEHVCRECYEEMARFGRASNDQYIEWKNNWVQESRCAPTLRIFTLDALLPFWISCNKCGKFRKTSTDENQWTVENIANFTCSQLYNTSNPCEVEEDKKVASARELTWIQTVSAPTFLHNSPALRFLKNEYYVDEVGLSPNKAAQATLPDAKAASFMMPFNVPNNASVAFCIRPDGMEHDELQSFPEFSSEPVPYFGLRNLVVALWALDPFEYLTFEKCLYHLVCRGLARVWYAEQLKRVYEYLCVKNVINYGILPFPMKKIIKEKVPRKALEVIVVGAGISGLCTARQLQMKGAKVTVLEAKDSCGGRMRDDNTLGVAVGCGAQLVTGCTNNAIILMCEQLGVSYRRLSDECPLVDSSNGHVISPSTDKVVDEHFNCLLDSVGEWRRVTKGGDASLLDKIIGFHRTFMNNIDFTWSKDYDRVLNWQIGNIEFSCGSRLSEVSARNWDQNEALGQFAGDHALLSEGSSKIIAGLMGGLDVRNKHVVNHIDYAKKSKKTIVVCSNGKRFTCDKVVLCLPLAVYQSKLIEFSPPLPSKKLDALKYLGAGLIEKVAVRFPRRFWSSLLKRDGTLDYFGHIPKDKKNRGLFNIFYDFSSRDEKNPKYVLMSYVCGDSIDLFGTLSNEEIVDLFVKTLRDLFPNEDVPDPIGNVVTSWKNDPYIGMSYSFIKINGTGEQYDNLAEPVNNQLYFAGECTNRFFPQTMTGAYVSGLRESSRIVENFILENSRS